MTKTNMDLSELLAKHDEGDFLRGIAEAVLQLIMETDVEGIIGAGRHERSGERTTWRNGYRERALDTRLGTLNLGLPKLRHRTPEQGREAACGRRGDLSNEASNMRLIGAVLFEQNDEWQTSSRFMMVETFARIYTVELNPILSITTKAA